MCVYVNTYIGMQFHDFILPKIDLWILSLSELNSYLSSLNIFNIFKALFLFVM